MSTWKTASLGEIFEIARGGSPRPIQDYLTDDPNGVNWISISDASASSKFITATKKRIRPEGVSRSRMVKPGDFLLTNSMSFGRPYIMGTNGCIHDGWLVLSSKHEDVDQDYFFQLLSSDFIYAKFSKLAAGATVKNLNIDLVSGVEVTFPPLEEQRRIAAILDQAETLRTQRRTALALLDSLTQSLFLDMFGDPVTNSKGWPISNIGREAKLQGGFAFKSNDYVVNGVRLVKISNVHRDALTWDDLDYLPESYIEAYKSFNLNIGDIVIALTRPIIQSLDSVKIAVVSAIDVPSLLNQRVGRFVITQPTRLEPQYLLGFCRSKAFFNAVSKFCSESLQPNMSTAQVEGLELPLPPLPLQQTFATRIASIEALKATHRSALAALDALFASLQQRAFAGTL